MNTRKILASAAAASMVLGSTAAAAAPAQGSREATALPEAEGMVGQSGDTLYIVLLGIVVIAGIIGAISANHEFNPRSP